MDGGEFNFDVQGHFVNPTGAWTKRLPGSARPLQMDKTRSCGRSLGPGRLDPTFLTHGPKTRREFMNLLAWSGGR